jgi:hypothetical protein
MKLATAKMFGATHTLNANREDARGVIRDFTGGIGARLCLRDCWKHDCCKLGDNVTAKGRYASHRWDAVFGSGSSALSYRYC